MTAANTSNTPAKGRSAVEEALIKAACKMLAEEGPKSMSVRNVAAAAGVNHGQVHHYFGGKRGLIMAAVVRLAQEHFVHAHARTEDNGVPPPLTLGQDSDYLHALVRLVLDGDLEAATAELEAGVSIPREALETMTGESNPQDLPLQIRSEFAVLMAIELGWAALESFTLMMSGITPEEKEQARGHARKMVGRLYSHFGDDS